MKEASPAARGIRDHQLDLPFGIISAADFSRKTSVRVFSN
jgi:hypothetical protein